MIQGTSSSVGKSIIAAALCRLFTRRGLKVAPFKAQNMALNSFVTSRGKEMGRAQVVQAMASCRKPEVDMNPILLKPEGDSTSQVVVMGSPWKTLKAREYYRYRDELWGFVKASMERLLMDNDLIIVEGAGSPAEINLKKNEIVNMRVAREFNVPVLLAGDIDRGGVFASLVGTLSLLEREERDLVKGFIINKFRGDIKLLEPGLDMLAELAGGIPTLGVIPYIRDIRMAQEDSVYLDENPVSGEEGAIDIVVIKFPRISNYDDFDALAMEEGVQVRFVDDPVEMGQPHAIILPGSKTTLKDLAWLRHKGLDSLILAHVASGASLVGICGGYQMLGSVIRDPMGVEGASGEQPGLGMLPVSTDFEPVKQTTQIKGTFHGGKGTETMEVEGYEIHMGTSRILEGGTSFLQLEDGRSDGCLSAGGRIWGTYLHGIFDTPAFRSEWLRSLGWDGTSLSRSLSEVREAEFERLADVFEQNMDIALLEKIAGL